MSWNTFALWQTKVFKRNYSLCLVKCYFIQSETCRLVSVPSEENIVPVGFFKYSPD